MSLSYSGALECPTNYTDIEFRAFIQNTPDLKDTSKRPYLSHLNKIQKYCNNAQLRTIFIDAHTWYPILEQKTFEGQRRPGGNKQGRDVSKVTLRTYIKTILATLKYSCVKQHKPDVYEIWREYFNKLSKEIADVADMNIAEDNYMEWTDVLERLKYLDQTNFGSIEHVTLALYTLIPPRRQLDYWKLATDPTLDTDDNKCTGCLWLRHPPYKIMVREYKTMDQYDIYENELPESIVKIMNAYLTRRTKAQQTFLLCKNNGNAYGSLSTFTGANNDVLKRALNNPNASVNTLRHSYATFVNMDPDMMRKEKKEIARSMGHSLEQQQMYVVARTPSNYALSK